MISHDEENEREMRAKLRNIVDIIVDSFLNGNGATGFFFLGQLQI